MAKMSMEAFNREALTVDGVHSVGVSDVAGGVMVHIYTEKPRKAQQWMRYVFPDGVVSFAIHKSKRPRPTPS